MISYMPITTVWQVPEFREHENSSVYSKLDLNVPISQEDMGNSMACKYSTGWILLECKCCFPSIFI
jgi:hypothetical protein